MNGKVGVEKHMQSAYDRIPRHEDSRLCRTVSIACTTVLLIRRCARSTVNAVGLACWDDKIIHYLFAAGGICSA